MAELERRSEEINRLNVFPVPDSDTGSNLAYTMRSALTAAERAAADDPASGVAEIAAALARGAVRGARGNSGVVLSQVLRGLAAQASAGGIDGPAAAGALKRAYELVREAISEPVEGTVLTVLRAAAFAPSEGDDLSAVIDKATAAARRALAATPSQLPALQEAGVVDAGGSGLVVLLETLKAEADGEEGATAPPEEDAGAPRPNVEVMFYATAKKPKVLEGLVSELRGLGDSLQVAAAGPKSATIHIHSRAPGRVVELAYARAQVEDLRLEVLPDDPRVSPGERLILAVAPGGAIKELYEQVGAEVIGPEGDPVAEIDRRLAARRPEELIVLPNGLLSARELASADKAAQARGCRAILLPTVRPVSGIAALSVHDRDQPLAAVAYHMAEAASLMRTAGLFRLEQAQMTAAGPGQAGDVCAANDEVFFVGEGIGEAIEHTLGALLRTGGEQVTILSRPEVELDAEGLSERFGVEVIAFEADTIRGLAEIGVE